MVFWVISTLLSRQWVKQLFLSPGLFLNIFNVFDMDFLARVKMNAIASLSKSLCSSGGIPLINLSIEWERIPARHVHYALS